VLQNLYIIIAFKSSPRFFSNNLCIEIENEDKDQTPTGNAAAQAHFVSTFLISIVFTKSSVLWVV